MEVFGFHTVEAENSEEESSVPKLPRKDFKNEPDVVATFT